jgi:hypothetical protein
MATVKNSKPERMPANSQGDDETFTRTHDAAEVMARAQRLFGAGMTKPAHGKTDVSA